MLWYFQRAPFLEQSLFYALLQNCWACWNQAPLRFGRTIFTCANRKGSLKQKCSARNSIILQLPKPKTSSLTTHRLPVVMRMNKCICFALIFRAVQTYMYSSGKKNISRSLAVQDYELILPTLRQQHQFGEYFVIFLFKIYFIGLTHCFGNHSG